MKSTKTWQLRSPKMTVNVTVDADYRIVSSPGVVKEFVGRSILQLKHWMDQHGKVTAHYLGRSGGKKEKRK